MLCRLPAESAVVCMHAAHSPRPYTCHRVSCSVGASFAQHKGLHAFSCPPQKDHDDLESLERDMNEESGWKLVSSCRTTGSSWLL